MNKSRLFVFQLKEIIYTLIFIILGIILVIVLFNMFNPSKTKNPDITQTSKNIITSEDTTNISYIPGIYSTSLELNNQHVNLEVTVDEHVVKDITLNNLSETTAVMYPLLEPSVEYIKTELAKGTKITEIKHDSSNQYTQTMLTNAIASLLEDAKK